MAMGQVERPKKTLGATINEIGQVLAMKFEQAAIKLAGIVVLSVSLMSPFPALADPLSEGAQGTLGPVTNLPLPRYVSLKTDEGNVRRGPSKKNRVDWVFVHENMPLKITAEYENWRRVEDADGQGGWIHYSLLSGVRTVLVEAEKLNLLRKPKPGAATRAVAERGVVARLGDCIPDWCEISSQGYSGWARKSDLWGVDEEEIRE
jgi:SH3-like domain-containing protein